METQSTENLISHLKETLKRRGWTYQQLGQAIGMSESGLKKLMTGKNLSLARLIQIAKVIDIPIGELMKSLDGDSISTVELSTDQERFLLKNPRCLHFYWRLKVEGMARADYQRKYGFSREETSKMQSQLEKVGLLKPNSRGQIEFTHGGAIRWKPESPVVKYLNELWSTQVIGRAAARHSAFDFINLSRLSLTETQVSGLRQDLLELFEKYSRMSLKNRDAGARSVGLLASFTEFDFELPLNSGLAKF